VSCGFAEGASPFLPPAELTSTGLSNLTSEFTGGIILAGVTALAGVAYNGGLKNLSAVQGLLHA
jgi:hypothetical protein